RRHTLNLFFVYDMPFGKGKLFTTNSWLDKVIGGWSFSGAFAAASGIPLDVVNSNSGEEFGSGDQSGSLSALIPLKGTLSSSSHYNFDGKGGVSALAGTAFDPTTAFRGLFFSDQRTGRGSVRSFPRWNMDAGLTKKTNLTERTSMTFGMQAVNVFNH